MLEIDGAAAGMTPATAVLLPGRHVVSFHKGGFERFSAVVDVSAQAPLQPAHSLTPLPTAASSAGEPPPKPAARPVAERPSAARAERPARPPPAADKPSAAPATPPARPTVKVIDDTPSSVRVIQ